ncbi:MAG: TlpA family protein disulfide reductase [Flavobacterium johnsoniae]|nr:MAG: TlpA family protein disulfide reductase [Flavobacterium johnsoniae]
MKNTLLYILISILAGIANKSTAQKKSYLEIHLDTKYPLDTVYLEIHSELSTGANYLLKIDESLSEISKDGVFKFMIPERKNPFYVSIHSPNTVDRKPFTWEQHYLSQYLIVPGDNILIKFDETTRTVSFSGKGCQKYQWRYAMDTMTRTLTTQYFRPGIKAREEIKAHAEILSNALRSLDSVKSDLTDTEYKLLRANTIGFLMGRPVLSLAFLKFHWSPDSKYYNDREEAEEYVRGYEKTYLKSFDDSSSYLTSSSSWATFLYHRAWANRAYDKFKGIPLKGSILEYIQLYPPGPIRDQSIIIFLGNTISSGKFTDSLFAHAKSFISTDKYRKEASTIFEKITAGSKVDDNFIFTDREGNNVRISDFKGKTVIIDMWFTGCIPCIQVAKFMPQIEENLKDCEDLLFVSLSVDKDKDDWLKSIDPNKNREDTFAYTHYTTPGTIYMYTSGTGSKNSFVKNYNPAGGFPRMIIIDKNGKLLTNSIQSPTNEKLAKQFEMNIRKFLKK